MLSYLDLHSSLNDSCHIINSIEPPDLEQLVPVDAHLEADWLSSSRWRVLESIDHYDAEILFRSPPAVNQILKHIDEFRRWWPPQERKSSFSTKVDELFAKPTQWPSSQPEVLNHFIKMHLPSPIGWLNEVRLWRNDDNGNYPWEGSNFSIAPSTS